MSSISCRNSETLNQSFEMRKKAGEYSLEEKLLFLHHFKDVGGTYVASMRELGLSDKEIKEDLNQMLGQMLNASKNIKGQVTGRDKPRPYNSDRYINVGAHEIVSKTANATVSHVSHGQTFRSPPRLYRGVYLFDY